MTKVAERYTVSGSYLARICTLLNVPRPQRGYWAKLSVGKAPPQVPLPPPRPGDPLDWSKENEAPRRPRPKAPVPHARRRRVKAPPGQVHDLIGGARTHFENGRPVKDDRYLRPHKKLLVDVTTSKDNLLLALNLANDLFNALESAGHRVVLAPPGAGLRCIAID
jgi:hypothetical protein